MTLSNNKDKKNATKSGHVSVGHPVDVASGVLSHDFEDFILSGKMPITFIRRYSSGLINNAFSSMFGPGWSSPFEMRLMQDLDGFRMIDEDGETEVLFDDFENKAESGENLYNFGAFYELRIVGKTVRVTHWNPDDFDDIKIFIFDKGKPGQWWPLSKIRDTDDQGIDLEYDQNLRINCIWMKREQGKGIKFEYNPSGRVHAVWAIPSQSSSSGNDHNLPFGAQTRGRIVLTYEYDASGHLIKMTDALSQSCHYEYDISGRMTKEINIAGMTYLFSYDEKGRCIENTGEKGYGYTRLEFFDQSQKSISYNIYKHPTVYEWNNNGQVTREVSPLGNAKSTVYDDYGRIIKKISATGAIETSEFDDFGNKKTHTSAEGTVVAYQYNNNHQITAITDPAGNTWKRTYDERGRINQVINPLSHTLSFIHNDYGDIVNIVDAHGNKQNFTWDRAGNLASSTDWMNNRTTYEYDKEGILTAIIDPQGNRTQAKIDELGRIQIVTLPDGAVRKFSWNAYDDITSYTDEIGAITQWHYKECGLLSEVKRPNQAKVQFEWDLLPGQLLGVINERGEKYHFEYNLGQQLIKETDFSGRITRYDYNADNEVSVIQNNAGHRTDIVRTKEGLITKVSHHDGSCAHYEYEKRGFLVKADNGTSVVERTFDELGRLLKEKQGDHEIQNTYNELGFRTNRTSSVGDSTIFSWDANGQISSIKNGSFEPISFKYDSLQNEISRFVNNGIRIDSGYDNRGRLINQSVRLNKDIYVDQSATNHTAIIKRSFTYDPAGNLIRLSDKNWGTTQYTYDIVGHIVKAQFPGGFTQRFEYDATDNISASSTRTTTSNENLSDQNLDKWNYAPGNVLIGKNNETYEYDSLGQRIKKTEKSGATTHYSWDQNGQLTCVQLPNGEVWNYSYDAFSRRIKKTGPKETTQFIWDGDVVLHEINCENIFLDSKPLFENPKVKNIHWEFYPLTFEPLAKIEHGEQYLFINDVNGAPREIVDKYGTIVWSGLYSVWGKLIEEKYSGVKCPVRFQGQWFDKETELHYNRFRYYDPESGEYISQDPIGFMGWDFNGYSYIKKPNCWIDPLGLNGLIDLVNEAHSLLDPFAQEKKTTAIGRNSRGELFISSSDPKVPRIQEDWAKSKGIKIIHSGGKDIHAEEALAKSKKGIVHIESSRGICVDCEELIKKRKIKTNTHMTGKKSKKRLGASCEK